MAGAHNSLMMMLLLLLMLINSSSSSNDECRKSTCGPNQPIIRFPFQLVKESSHDRCLNPEFCLYCTQNNKTMLSLPTTSGPIQFLVPEIDYEFNSISISDPDNCFPEKFLKLKLYNSSFLLPYENYSQSRTIVFFNCSSVREGHLRNEDQVFDNTQDMSKCQIYAAETSDSVLAQDLTSCIKMFEVNTSIRTYDLRFDPLYLNWPNQNCSECEAKGMKCKWKNNGTKGETECFYCNSKHQTIQISKSLTYTAAG